MTSSDQSRPSESTLSDAELGYASTSPERVHGPHALAHHTLSRSSTMYSTQSTLRHFNLSRGTTISRAERNRLFLQRLRGKGKRKVGWLESGKNALFCSWLNIFLPAIPFAWAAHFYRDTFSPQVTFALCFIGIMPLQAMFDWGGEQMAIYLGKTLGDLLMITLNNVVEVALAVILLIHCELRLLQSTIIGVIILHLLLVPGTAFLANGVRIWEQTLHPQSTELNHSLLSIGVLAIMLPTVFFAALDRGITLGTDSQGHWEDSALISDDTRSDLLQMSRGFAFMLGIVYIGSRVYLAMPVDDDTGTIAVHPDVPDEIKEEEEELRELEPECNPLACLIVLVVCVGLASVTAEWLVTSIQSVKESGHIREEWFGLILLPFISFSAEGMVTIVFFVQSLVMHCMGKKVMVPSILAHGRAIDLAIQFILWWTPVILLLGWALNKPVTLLFDFYEMALLIGACFLVNCITADAKTNWVEGLILLTYYIMIAISSWFYVGQPELKLMLFCPASIADSLAAATHKGAAALALD
ncbi:hypothetical protein EIP91_003713 [Steccherinum ochraceum]|uniref:Sodium/calcium exchanger membrane region domain-containing protein n=1 Tax=Steccherinum ochraceum TaxID=92696 RepID=A0A4R0RNW0_9APHY|nr:hypothetical protein EIP91_003713 [Steccherinum ochraceum]